MRDDRRGLTIDLIQASGYPDATLEQSTRVSEQEVAEYVSRLQAKFLETGDPHDRVDISAELLAWKFGVHETTIRRKLDRVVVVVGGTPTPASVLIQQIDAQRSRTVTALESLATDPNLFADGRWKVSELEIARALFSRFRLRVARRTVSKYLRIINKPPRGAPRTTPDTAAATGRDGRTGRRDATDHLGPDDPLAELRVRYSKPGTLMRDVDSDLMRRIRKAGQAEAAKRYLYLNMFGGDPLAHVRTNFPGGHVERGELWRRHPLLAAALRLQGTLDEAESSERA